MNSNYVSLPYNCFLDLKETQKDLGHPHLPNMNVF